jgi:hypothetical protein
LQQVCDQGNININDSWLSSYELAGGVGLLGGVLLADAINDNNDYAYEEGV